MGSPMLPSPMKPIFAMCFSSLSWLPLPVLHGERVGVRGSRLLRRL